MLVGVLSRRGGEVIIIVSVVVVCVAGSSCYEKNPSQFENSIP